MPATTFRTRFGPPDRPEALAGASYSVRDALSSKVVALAIGPQLLR